MKKLSFILAVIMLISLVITACGNEIAEGSQETSDEISSESSAAGGENSKGEDKDSVYTDVAVKNDPKRTAVSIGASYTISMGPDDQYPDTFGTELTDGVFVTGDAAVYSNEAFAGFISGGGHLLEMDLGREVDTIYELNVSYLATEIAGVARLGNVVVYASADGENWEKLGKAKINKTEEAKMETAVFTAEKYIKARYVRFFITGTNTWFFLDEVSVIADIESEDHDGAFALAVKNAYNALGTIARPEGSGDIDHSLSKVLISKGAKYKITGEVLDKFKDDGKKLTDGKMGTGSNGNSRVSLSGEKDVTVRVDLGKTETDIAAVEATFYANTTVKTFMPVAVKVAAIDENDNRTELGILYASTVLRSGSYSFALPLPKTISARYIEFTAVATDTSMLLAEEFAVYAYRAQDLGSMYPTPVYDKNPSDWGAEATNDYVNLVANTTQMIVSDGEPNDEQKNNNTPVTSTLMTDGSTAGGNTDIHCGRFFKFNGGGGRKIIFDLKHISAIDKVTASFTQLVSWGVNAPKEIEVAITEDGENWYTAGVMTKNGGAENHVYKYELKLSKKYKARYVSLRFTFESWAGCDEVEVFGTTSTAGAKNASSVGKKVTEVTGERLAPSEKLLKGAKDTCLLYHNNPAGYKVDDLIPYLAYVDQDGKMKDTMFDSFLFLYMGQFPSGGYPYSGGVKSDWEWVLNDLFGDGKNIKALDQAAGQVKEELGLGADHKYKVILSLYYPTASITNFGDVDGDGVSENFKNLDSRLKALQWYIDLIDKTYNEQNFKNIEFVGYYWFHETINTDDTESVELINKVADMVHAKGKDLCWIPYFLANGYNSWKDYGFDVAVMQPNYAFKEEASYSNVVDCAKLTAQHGLGFEIEISYLSMSSDEFFNRYMQYISAGVEYGYMNDCIVMYYQEIFIYRDAARAKNRNRQIYDITYQFIKGDLKYKPDAITGITYDCTKDTPIDGKFTFTEDLTREFALSVAPERGTVTVHNDGSFTYYPEKGFTGEVKFSIVYRENFGWSDNCEVTVTVK